MEIMFIHLCINNTITENVFYSFIEEHDALISSSIIILLFIIERVYSLKSNKKQAKREWYLNTIVNPNLKSITKFYHNCIEIVKSNQSLNLNQLSVVEFKGLIKNTTLQFKELKKDFDHEFIELVRSVSSNRAKNLRDCISELDDMIISTFHIEDSKTIDLDKLVSNINSNKSKFFSELFEEIKNN